MVEECRVLLSNVTLQSHVSDTWQWHPDIVGVTQFVQVTSCSLLRNPLYWTFQIT